MRLYIAGPLGFSQAGQEFHFNVLIPKLASLGLEILDPWSMVDKDEVESIRAMDPGPTRVASWRCFNDRVGRNNRVAIDSCDAVFAVLDGTDVDSGTSSEIGYAFAREKNCRIPRRLSARNIQILRAHIRERDAPPRLRIKPLYAKRLAALALATLKRSESGLLPPHSHLAALVLERQRPKGLGRP